MTFISTLAPGVLGHIMHVRTIDGSNVDRYYHYDRLGNVMNVTDENGLALVNYVQEGFGNVLLTQEDFARLEMHSPIAAYDLPEGSGSSTADRTSNNYDGTISGASWATGEFTYGLSFDGSDDKVSFSTPPSTSGSFSVAAWVKIDSTSWFHPVVTNFTPGMDIELKGWRFGVNNGKVCLQLWDCWEEPYEALGTTTLSTSKWYLIAATYDSSGGAMKVYVNGADDTSGSPTGDYTTGDNFGIGWDGTDFPYSDYFDGLIDSVAVYNAKLSSTQVQQLWDSGDKSGYHLTTKEYDPDTGLYYFYMRWYTPELGLFIKKDAIVRNVLSRVTHLYSYSGNNPVNFFDPDGLDVCKWHKTTWYERKEKECSWEESDTAKVTCKLACQDRGASCQPETTRCRRIYTRKVEQLEYVCIKHWQCEEQDPKAKKGEKKTIKDPNWNFLHVEATCYCYGPVPDDYFEILIHLPH